VPPWSDGTKKLARDLVTRLNSFSFQVMTSRGEVFDKEGVESLPIYASSGKYNPAFWENLKAFWYLLREKAPVDLYHFFFSPNPVSSRVVRLLLKFKKKKSVQTICSCPKSFQGFKKYIATDFIITLSDYAKNKVQALGFENVCRIYPGIDLEEYQPLTANSLRSDPHFGPGPVVLYVGDYEFSGAHENILKVSQEILKKFSDVKFVFACRKKTPRAEMIERDVKKSAEELGVSSNFIFINEIQNFKELLDIAYCIIFPAKSLYRKMDIPLTLLEAMAMKKPIIISDIAPHNEIMKGDAGFLVPPDDTAALFKALHELLEDEEGYRMRSENAREIVKTHFNISDTVEQYKEFYERVLDEKR